MFRRVHAIMTLLVFLLLYGYITYRAIPREAMPNVQIPVYVITVDHHGMAAPDAARCLLKPMETELKTLEGIKHYYGFAYEGGATQVVEFEFGTKHVSENVRAKLDQVVFPEKTEKPAIQEIKLGLMPVLALDLYGDIDFRQLRLYARRLQSSLRLIEEVYDVVLQGDKTEVITLTMGLATMHHYKLYPDALKAAITTHNKPLMPGKLFDNFSLNIREVLSNTDQIKRIWLPRYQQHLGDIIPVHATFKTPDVLLYKQHMPCIRLMIKKNVGSDILTTVTKVKQRVNAVTKDWPVSKDFSRDVSENTQSMQEDMLNTLFIAVALVMLVIFYALGWAFGLLVCLTVPASFLIGLVFLSFTNITLNNIVLFALIFAIGMLVDGAIIIVEYAELKMREGLDLLDAYQESVKRMLWPVVSAISMVIVVFIPLLFWPDVMGQFMFYMPLTLICVLSASLLVALVFVPIIGYVFRIQPVYHTTHDLAWYRNILLYALERPWKVIATACGLLVFVCGLQMVSGSGIEFFPHVDAERMLAFIRGDQNLSIEEKTALVQKAANHIKGNPDVQSLTTFVGQIEETPYMDTIGQIDIELMDWRKRPKAKKIMQAFEKQCRDLQGVVVAFHFETNGPSQMFPIELVLKSDNWQELIKEAQKLTKQFEKFKDVSKVTNNLSLDKVAWRFHLKNHPYTNIVASDIEEAFQLINQGIVLGKIMLDTSDKEVDIVLKFPEHQRTQWQQLCTLKSIPLGVLGELKPEVKAPSIRRFDGQYAVKIMADGNKTSIAKAMKQSDIQHKFVGEDEEEASSRNFLIKAFAGSLFMVILLLLLQFRHIMKTLIILSAVVFSTFGVMLGLWIHRTPFSIVMGGLSVIALAGIVLSNNIILLDTFDQKEGTLKDRIVATCLDRFRPVILTKLTTILGLLPILLGVNIDVLRFSLSWGSPSIDMWQSLAICIVYGVLFASSLTLIVTPCMLYVWGKEKS